MLKNQRDTLICTLYKEGYTINQIKDKTNVSHATIYRVLKENEIMLRKEALAMKRRKAIEKVVELFDAGVDYEEISRKVGLKPQVVYAILIKLRPCEFKAVYQRKKQQKRKVSADVKNKAVPNNSNILENQNANSHVLDIMAEADVKKNCLIMRDYMNGVPLQDILKKYAITTEYLYYLAEGCASM